MKKLLKSEICGSRTLFMGPIELIKGRKNQQTTAIDKGEEKSINYGYYS